MVMAMAQQHSPNDSCHSLPVSQQNRAAHCDVPSTVKRFPPLARLINVLYDGTVLEKCRSIVTEDEIYNDQAIRIHNVFESSDPDVLFLFRRMSKLEFP